MASPLDGQIKRQVAAAFRGRLQRGTLRRPVSDSLNGQGDPVAATPQEYSFEGIRESYSAVARGMAGIPAEDVKFIVLLGSTSITPQRGDYIKLSNTSWHMIREVPEIDPAGATATCQCYAVPELT